MRAIIISAVAAAATLAAAGAANAEGVEIKDAALRVVVIPENRSDVKVEVLRSHPKIPVTVRNQMGAVIVDGGLGRNAFVKPFSLGLGGDRIRGCKSRNGHKSVDIAGVGEVAYDALPQIVVRTPRKVEVKAGGAVFGEVGRADAVEIRNAGCGDWTVANVAGKLDVHQAGSGDTLAGAIGGGLEIHIAGSGDVKTQAVRGDVEVHVAGSGDVQIASMDGGLLKSRVAGSGNVAVDQGRASRIDVNVAGSGDIRFGGTAGEIDAAVAGSGDINVARVTGAVRKRVAGSGEVRVGG